MGRRIISPDEAGSVFFELGQLLRRNPVKGFHFVDEILVFSEAGHRRDLFEPESITDKRVDVPHSLFTKPVLWGYAQAIVEIARQLAR